MFGRHLPAATRRRSNPNPNPNHVMKTDADMFVALMAIVGYLEA